MEGKEKIIAIHSFPNWLPQTQTWMYHQVKYLPENVDVHIACEEKVNIDQFGVPNIHCVRDISNVQFLREKWMRKLRMRPFLRYLSSVVREVDAHLVHSHFGHIGWSNLAAVEQNNVKHIITFYGADVSKLPAKDGNWLDRYHELFDKADQFLCEGPHMAGKLVEMGCPGQKISIHHLGVEVERIPFKPRHWQPGEPFRVLIAGAFREKKGIPYALEALGKLKHVLPLEITLLGDAGSERSSRQEKRAILKTLDETGLASCTRLLGFQPYVVFFEEVYKHHVFVSPSIHASDGDTEGGAPVSLIDVMATGMPVVSTRHCDIPAVVQYELDGWLVKERDVDGLAEKLVWLIENPEYWLELSVQGRRHIERGFNASQQGRRLGEIYESVVRS